MQKFNHTVFLSSLFEKTTVIMITRRATAEKDSATRKKE
jgi:hypothetical protein